MNQPLVYIYIHKPTSTRLPPPITRTQKHRLRCTSTRCYWRLFYTYGIPCFSAIISIESLFFYHISNVMRVSDTLGVPGCHGLHFLMENFILKLILSCFIDEPRQIHQLKSIYCWIKSFSICPPHGCFVFVIQ